MKDYDIDIQYHPGKANMGADALSRKTTYSSTLITRKPQVQEDLKRADIVVVTERIIAQMARLIVQPTLR